MLVSATGEALAVIGLGGEKMLERNRAYPTGCDSYTDELYDTGYYTGFKLGEMNVIVETITRMYKAQQKGRIMRSIRDFLADDDKQEGIMEDIIRFAEKYPNLSSEKLCEKILKESEFKYV